LVQDICPRGQEKKVRRLTEFCLTLDSPVVPDPYYGGASGFDAVLDLVEDACDGLLRHVLNAPGLHTAHTEPRTTGGHKC
jgi:protein-tyrosine phosphatase